jgi:hypothetical protein
MQQRALHSIQFRGSILCIRKQAVDDTVIRLKRQHQCLLTACRISCRFAHVIACFAAVVLLLFLVDRSRGLGVLYLTFFSMAAMANWPLCMLVLDAAVLSSYLLFRWTHPEAKATHFRWRQEISLHLMRNHAGINRNTPKLNLISKPSIEFPKHI